jgi:hypothetical protein
MSSIDLSFVPDEIISFPRDIQWVAGRDAVFIPNIPPVREEQVGL